MRYALVKRHALCAGRHVGCRQICVLCKRDGAFGLFNRLFAFFLKHGFVEQLYIHIISHIVEMTVLLGAEDASRAAYLKVAQRDAEASAELGVLAYRLKPLFRYLGQRPAARIGEIRIRAARRTSDTSAELMELRKPHAVRAVNYERVRIRNVNAGLDYRGAYENIYLPRRHVRPYLLKAFLLHLAVRRDDGSVGHLAICAAIPSIVSTVLCR